MTRVTVRTPTPLRTYTRGADEVEIEGRTVAECLVALADRFEGIRERILDERGELRRFVNVFRGPTDVRALQGLETPVEDESGAVLIDVREPDQVAQGSPRGAELNDTGERYVSTGLWEESLSAAGAARR